MAFSLSQLFTPTNADGWETSILSTLTGLGLKTTSWQSGGMMRLLIRALAVALAAGDQIVATVAQGGFLDFAADPSVTPDPSITPGVAPGWLDILADSGYNVQRVQATFATQTVTFNNTTLTNYGPFAPQTFHIANPTTGATYSNRDTLTIKNSLTGPATSAVFVADLSGPTGSSGAGAVTQLVTVVAGVTVTNALAFVGSLAESNVALAARCRLKLQSLSPNGPSGAYDYFALTASQVLAAESPPLSLAGGTITRSRAVSSTASGVVTETIANATGAPSGAALVVVTGATNATPIRVQTATAHGMNASDTVIVAGVVGNLAANGTFTAQPFDATHFDLYVLGTSTPVAGSGAYVSGGVAECGDVGLVDSVIQANAVPDSVTAFTQAAVNVAVRWTIDVWVPASQAAAVTAVVEAAVQSYMNTLPIGGLSDPGGAYTNVLPYNFALAVVGKAAAYIQQAALTLNGGTANISLPLTPVPSVGTLTAFGSTVGVNSTVTVHSV